MCLRVQKCTMNITTTQLLCKVETKYNHTIGVNTLLIRVEGLQKYKCSRIYKKAVNILHLTTTSHTSHLHFLRLLIYARVDKVI